MPMDMQYERGLLHSCSQFSEELEINNNSSRSFKFQLKASHTLSQKEKDIDSLAGLSGVYLGSPSPKSMLCCFLTTGGAAQGLFLLRTRISLET